jgi:hypothetical protein
MICSYLRRLFRDLFYRKGYQLDFIFDWTIKNQNETELSEAKKGIPAVGADGKPVGALLPVLRPCVVI